MDKNNPIVKFLLKDKRISEEFKKVILGGNENE